MFKPIDLKDIHQIGEYLYLVDRLIIPNDGEWVYSSVYHNPIQKQSIGVSKGFKIILTNDPKLEGVTQFEIEDEVEQLAYKLYPENINKMMLGLDENKQRRDYFIEDYNYFLILLAIGDTLGEIKRKR